MTPREQQMEELRLQLTTEHARKSEQWQQLLDLLSEADSLQQRLLDPRVSYGYHNQLEQLIYDLGAEAVEAGHAPAY